jgi:tRNA 2-selenouridine synthase
MQVTPPEVYPVGAGAPRLQVIDVRAPIEVARGALPGARALPLMNDEERHRIGIRYQEAGQEAAIALGYELAGPHLATRTAAWRAAARAVPSVIACWRGGLRSAIAQSQLGDPIIPTVAGGYKALRAHLLTHFRDRVQARPLWVLGGLTGSGKTELLQRLASAPGPLTLDLEGLASHRGSAFGAEDGAQPAQATFENALAATTLLSPHLGALIVEDESRYVGVRLIPDALWVRMRTAPMVWLEAPLAERSARVIGGYVLTPAHRHGVTATHARLVDNLTRIRRRLGAELLAQVRSELDAARADWFEPAQHEGWVRTLLRDYYDRLYLHSFEKSGRAVHLRGDHATVLEFLQQAGEGRGTAERGSMGG